MSKNLIFVLGLFVFISLGLFLFFLPKSVVDSNKKLAENQTEEKTNSPSSDHDQVHQADNQLVTAIASLKKEAIKEGNQEKKAEILSSIGKAFLKVNQFDSAGHYLEMSAVSGNNAILFDAGNAYFEGLAFSTSPSKTEFLSQKARKCFEKLDNSDSRLAEAQAKIAMTYVNTEAPMKGILMLRELSEKYPENEYIAYQLGILSFQSGQYEKAIGRFEKVLKINSGNVNAYYYLAQSLVQVGRGNDSKPIIEKGLKLAKEDDTKASFQELKKQISEN